MLDYQNEFKIKILATWNSYSIPGSERSPGEGNDKPLLAILAWIIPLVEEPSEVSQKEKNKWKDIIYQNG